MPPCPIFKTPLDPCLFHTNLKYGSSGFCVLSCAMGALPPAPRHLSLWAKRGDRGTVPICPLFVPPATTDNDARRDAVTQCRTRTENPADLAGQGSPFSRPPFFPSFLSASLRLCVRYNSFLGRMLHTSIQSPHPRSSTEGLRPGWIAFDALQDTGRNIRPAPEDRSPSPPAPSMR
jgi:hypothetical protein